MFPIPLGLLGSAGGAVASAGVLATLAASLYAFRKKIPNPTEFWIFGCWFRWLGIHTHDAFDMVVDIQTVSNVPSNAKLFLFIKSGRFEEQSTTEISTNETGINCKCNFFQRIPIRVRQNDNQLKIKLYRSTPLSSELLGEYDVSVEVELIQADFPRNRVITMQKDGQNTCNLHLSFFKVEPLPLVLAGTNMAHSKIVQQAMIQSQLDGHPVDPSSLLHMSPAKRMIFFSKILEGPLRLLRKVAATDPWVTRYFRATTTKQGIWMWCGWDTQKAMKEKQNPVVLVPILAISAVLKNEVDNSRHQFFIRYQSKSGVKDMYLERVDRDRDLWVQGLYEFIQMARDEYSKVPSRSEAEQALLDKEEELSRYRKELLTNAVPAGVKTLAAPRLPNETETAGRNETETAGRNETETAGRNETRASSAFEDMYRWMNDPEVLEEEMQDEIKEQQSLVAVDLKDLKSSDDENEEEKPFLANR